MKVVLYLLTMVLVTNLPLSVLAQSNPDYLKELPTEERVLNEIKGSSPEDTAQRQVGAFLQLIRIIPYMHGVDARIHGALSPAAKKWQADYKAALTRVWMSRPELKDRKVPSDFSGSISWVSGGYDTTKEFRDELLIRFFSPAVRTKYYKEKGEWDAAIQKRIEAGTRTYFQDEKTVVDKTSLDYRVARCIAAGRNPARCTGDMIAGGLGDIKKMFDPSAETEIEPGLKLAGSFPGKGGYNILNFGPTQIVASCEGFPPAFTTYNIERRGSQVYVNFFSGDKKEISLEVMPDGRLNGVGRNYKVTKTDGITGATSVVAECSIGMLGPAAEVNYGLLGGMADEIGAEAKATGLIAHPGFRMGGKYVLPGGLRIEFFPEAALLECDEVLAGQPYTVERKANQFFVTIQIGSGPVKLELKSDGTLSGLGDVVVNGQRILGFVPDQQYGGKKPAFEKGTATCSIDKAPPVTSAGSPQSAVLTVTSGFAGRAGSPDVLVGKGVVLLKKSLDTILKESADFVNPPNATTIFSPIVIWANSCQIPQYQVICNAGIQQMGPHNAGIALMDPSGKITLPAVPPGVYYVVSRTGYNNRHLVWNVRVNLQPGANSIMLDERNATPVN